MRAGTRRRTLRCRGLGRPRPRAPNRSAAAPSSGLSSCLANGEAVVPPHVAVDRSTPRLQDASSCVQRVHRSRRSSGGPRVSLTGRRAHFVERLQVRLMDAVGSRSGRPDREALSAALGGSSWRQARARPSLTGKGTREPPAGVVMGQVARARCRLEYEDALRFVVRRRPAEGTDVEPVPIAKRPQPLQHCRLASHAVSLPGSSASFTTRQRSPSAVTRKTRFSRDTSATRRPPSTTALALSSPRSLKYGSISARSSTAALNFAPRRPGVKAEADRRSCRCAR